MTGFEVRGENVPRCPHCGWQLAPWVRDDTFLQSAAWREGLGRYERFVRERGDGRVLLLELDVGKMTPGIITLSLGNKRMPAPISIGAGMSNQRFIGAFIIRLDVLCPHN